MERYSGATQTSTSIADHYSWTVQLKSGELQQQWGSSFDSTELREILIQLGSPQIAVKLGCRGRVP